MKGSVVFFTFALAVTLAGSLAWADEDTPVGRWRQIDDETGEARSIVKIYQDNGVLKGEVVELLAEPEDEGPPVCDQCQGELKNAPILGFPLLSGMTKDGDEWTRGTIIDPENGKEYQAKLSLDDNGRKLNVRGFIGLSLFGRTQVWERIETSRNGEGQADRRSEPRTMTDAIN